jgi:hypothetical protein
LIRVAARSAVGEEHAHITVLLDLAERSELAPVVGVAAHAADNESVWMPNIYKEASLRLPTARLCDGVGIHLRKNEYFNYCGLTKGGSLFNGRLELRGTPQIKSGYR